MCAVTENDSSGEKVGVMNSRLHVIQDCEGVLCQRWPKKQAKEGVTANIKYDRPVGIAHMACKPKRPASKAEQKEMKQANEGVITIRPTVGK